MNRYVIALTVHVEVLAMNDKVAADDALKAGKDLVKDPTAAITSACVVRQLPPVGPENQRYLGGNTRGIRL